MTDAALGWIELALVPLSLAGLLLALRQPRTGVAPAALALAALLAVTVAQPLGIVRKPIDAAAFAAGDPRPADPTATHTLDVLGIPLLRFKPLRRDNPYALEGEDPAWFKVRSWVVPGFFTNATKLERMCDDRTSPCWDPGNRSYGRDPDRNLELVRDGREWRYAIYTREGEGGSEGDYWGQGYYRVAAGITSWAGVAYWLVAGALAVAIVRRRRRPLISPAEG